MKKTKKTILIIALCMMVCGVALMATGCNNPQYETKTYNVQESFKNIAIDVTTADISFVLSSDEVCKVVCHETKNLTYSVTTKNDTLTIKANDNRKWFDFIGIIVENLQLTVYLPQNQYETLSVDTNTGIIELADSFTFDNIYLESDTGSINCFASAKDVEISCDTGKIKVENISAEKLSIENDTGNITLNNSTVTEIIDIEADTGSVIVSDVDCGSISTECDTGDIKLSNVNCTDLNSDCNTGDIILTNVIASDKIKAINNTGDIKLDKCDADSLYLETNTGDVTGTLLSEKIFYAEADTGSVNVPHSTTGGLCEIKVDTGDIKISIVKP